MAYALELTILESVELGFLAMWKNPNIYVHNIKFVKDLGSRITEATGEKRAKSFLFQSLSMNLQRGNAICVMGTVAHHRKLEEIYNLGTISTQEE